MALYVTNTQLAGRPYPADKEALRRRLDGPPSLGRLVGDPTEAYNEFVAKEPEFAKHIFKLTETFVGPGELLMCYLFDNVTINFNRSPDLLVDGKPTFECKSAKLPSRGEWKGYAVDFSLGDMGAYQLFDDLHDYRVNHIQYNGQDVPELTSVYDMKAASLRYIKNTDIPQHPKYETLERRWAKTTYKSYIEDKNFLLFDRSTAKLVHAGPLFPHQLSVYRVHRQVYAGVKMQPSLEK
jgi:hypothetical protein